MIIEGQINYQSNYKVQITQIAKQLKLVTFYKYLKQHQIEMEKMIKIFNKVIKQNTIYNKILYDSKGHTQKNYKQAVEDFSILSCSQKQRVISQIMSKFKTQRQTEFILSALLLIDYLQTVDPQMSFSNCYQPKLLKNSRKQSKNKKIYVAQEQFINFYFSYIKLTSLKCQREIDFNNCSLQEYMQYCEIGLKIIFQMLKIDFIIDFCLKNSNQIDLIKMCCLTIFERISFDIRIVHKFLDKWLHLATSNEKQAFKVNQIYQKVIYLNKNISKLKVLTKQLYREIKLNVYELDNKLNTTILKNMYERSSERKEYISSKKTIQLQTTGQDKGSSLTQADSMMRFTQFI